MTITALNEAITKVTADAIVVGCYKEGKLSTTAAEVDTATGGAISRLIESGDVTGKRNETTMLLAPTGVAAMRVLVLGLGERDKVDRAVAFEAAATAAYQIAAKQRDRVVMAIADEWATDVIDAAVCGSLVGCTNQDLYRSEKNRHPIGEIIWNVEESQLEGGRVLGESVNLTRRLVNEPPNAMYPESFAGFAQEVADETDLELEIWDKAKLTEEKCGSLLAVGRASVKEPRLVMLRHNGGPKDQAPIALVGKGVTFDSGGLSLKLGDGMLAMKCDMAGAATVLGAMRAIAKLNLPVNVIGLMGMVENLINGDAYKLGDVLTARNGKTIEVHNTDAEGRLVLADVLDVAVTSGAAKIIDLATLTGACMVALGNDVAGVMTNDETWQSELQAAAATCGEQVWPLPMFDDYGEQLQSKVADLKNVGDGRWGGAITAAKFLENFVGDTPWTHIDIAGPAFAGKSKSWLEGGGSGKYVRTLVELINRLA